VRQVRAPGGADTRVLCDSDVLCLPSAPAPAEDREALMARRIRIFVALTLAYFAALVALAVWPKVLVVKIVAFATCAVFAGVQIRWAHLDMAAEERRISERAWAEWNN